MLQKDEKMPSKVLIWPFVVLLWPWPLTFDSKSNQLIFVKNCAKVVNLVKFPQVVFKTMC